MQHNSHSASTQTSKWANLSTSDDDYVVLSCSVYLMMPLARIKHHDDYKLVKYGLFQNIFLEEWR
jgi:hypothetical protein